jgi:dipeptidase E
VGGGNTFRLLQCLHETGLLDAIRERVLAGMPYLGWSAGSNVACPTIRTTNDMPVVEPPSLDALNLLPFQLNPHYSDYHPPGHRGETRAERLAEFVALNAGVPVLGLREGSILRREGERLTLLGVPDDAVLLGLGAMQSVHRGDDLSYLLSRG